MELIIEQISRGHKVIARYKFEPRTVNIGRGFDNDIILSDPHVCANHLQLHYDDGQWLLRDLDTVNGSFNGSNKAIDGQHQVLSGDLISLGKSQLRLLYPDHPVEESVRLSPFENVLELIKSPWLLVLFISLFTAANGLNFLWHANEDTTTSQLLVSTLGTTLVFALWPLLCALVARLTKHDARVMAQLTTSFLFFNLFLVSDLLEMLLGFNLSSQWPVHWLSLAISMALVGALLWVNFYLAFHMAPRRRLLLACSLTALLFGGSYLLKSSQQPDFREAPVYNPILLSPGFIIAPSSSVETFIDDSSGLFEKAERAADQPGSSK